MTIYAWNGPIEIDTNYGDEQIITEAHSTDRKKDDDTLDLMSQVC